MQTEDAALVYELEVCECAHCVYRYFLYSIYFFNCVCFRKRERSEEKGKKYNLKVQSPKVVHTN